jgi:glycosyltransferase involved in cell wall biosynthesis
MTAYKPCLIIPVYNHHREFSDVLPEIVKYEVDCIIIDDGSNKACKDALIDEANKYPNQCRLVHLPKNQGKGGAVCSGLAIAKEHGYSHALQIDSDGQHDPAFIPIFLQTSQLNPTAIICGVRPYKEMPKGRRYGRFVTDFWVWVNTLSFEIKDSMSGYRMYPIDKTVEFLNEYTVGQRMDFDTDILVRLSWKGFPVEQITTNVVYAEDIVSHFDMVKDNVRISKMHTKLFFLMLRQLPKLIIQKIQSSQ